MKVTLDIDQLLSDGRISQGEYDRLKQFSTENTASLALNILLAFGIIAVAGGTIALLQSSFATIALGAILAGAGGGICADNLNKWKLLGNILLPLGALTAAGGIIVLTDGHISGFTTVAGLLIASGLMARSGLLVSLSVFAILSALGGTTGYEHAAYYLDIERPLLTVVVFSLLAALTFAASRFLPVPYARLASVFSCTAVVVANFGFWVGSLWGDSAFNSSVSEWCFIVAWAVLILAVGVWGVLHDSRWLINSAATFGAIHLYTQWFEHFEASPGSIVVAGLFTIVIAYALISYNRRAKKPPTPAATK
jgi:iron complex transport system permease protein